ncbi:MAG: hypothetical protein GY760_23270 [Deltaproteobacteria bacterium]|nr:hypothetical protein [Deltaproteobacteria bacterium]
MNKFKSKINEKVTCNLQINNILKLYRLLHGGIDFANKVNYGLHLLELLDKKKQNVSELLEVLYVIPKVDEVIDIIISGSKIADSNGNSMQANKSSLGLDLHLFIIEVIDFFLIDHYRKVKAMQLSDQQ